MDEKRTTWTRLLLTAFLALALVPIAAVPVTAHHDGSDHPCEDPCEPSLTVTGGRVDGPVPNPWGYDPLYAGWTIVDLEIPEDCECFVESWDLRWRTVVDNPLPGSAGVDATQLDDGQWLVHNLDGDVYQIFFTVWVVCADGTTYQVTEDWYQFN